MEATRIWTGLGVVGTIYEDDDDEDDDTSTALSVSPLLRSPSSTTPLHSRIEAWSLATGLEADVVIHIQNSRFCLHKDALASRSGYFRRHLKGLTELIVSPPLKITAETFTLVAEFCYGAHLVITSFDVVSLRVAAELLEMTEVNGALDENLRQKTEVYFRRAVSVNREHASIVLRTCLTLLPEAETTASLVTRCIEALTLTDDDCDDVMRCFSDVKDVSPQDFELIMESMNQRLTGSHDLLYKIVDLYLKEYRGKMTDEEKSRMCNYIDCTSLSAQHLMHAVQNPRMPLRLVVQAMFVEQLNTRRSIVNAADHHHHHHRHQNKKAAAVTLGSILQHDAALRQVAQLQAAMNATSSRIESLENQLSGMKKLLHESSSTTKINALDSGRSASFRLSSEENKIERGQIGSVSSGSFRVITSGRDHRAIGGTSSSEGSYEENTPRSSSAKKFSRRLMNGLKNSFRVPTFLSKNKSDQTQASAKIIEEKTQHVIVIKKDIPYHRQSS